MPLLILITVGVFVLAHTAPFPFVLEAFRPSRSLWHVPAFAGAPPTVYLTFDDGPNGTWTPPLLDALREAQARATFFLIDEHITSATAPVVRRIAAEGHAIGLHSGTRRLMFEQPDELAAALLAAAGRIEDLTGAPPCRLFRPHAGWRSSTMYQGVERAGYRLAGWSWGMWDWHWWQRPRADRVAERLARKASAGDVIVIHDGHHKDATKDRSHAAGAVRLLVPELRSRGYVFGTLCAPQPEPTGVS